MHRFAFNSENTYWFLALTLESSELYYSYFFFEERCNTAVGRGWRLWRRRAAARVGSVGGRGDAERVCGRRRERGREIGKEQSLVYCLV